MYSTEQVAFSAPEPPPLTRPKETEPGSGEGNEQVAGGFLRGFFFFFYIITKVMVIEACN